MCRYLNAAERNDLFVVNMREVASASYTNDGIGVLFNYVAAVPRDSAPRDTSSSEQLAFRRPER